MSGYINVAVWGAGAIACAQHLVKGRLVGVIGRLEFREWTTEDGLRRHDYAAVGTVEFLDAPSREPEGGESDVG